MLYLGGDDPVQLTRSPTDRQGDGRPFRASRAARRKPARQPEITIKPRFDLAPTSA
jgi:hypothetical protein